MLDRDARRIRPQLNSPDYHTAGLSGGIHTAHSGEGLASDLPIERPLLVAEFLAHAFEFLGQLLDFGLQRLYPFG